MSLHSKILKIFSLSVEQDFDLKAARNGKEGTMTTLGNLLPLIILVVFIGIVAIVGYQVSHRHCKSLLLQDSFYLFR